MRTRARGENKDCLRGRTLDRRHRIAGPVPTASARTLTRAEPGKCFMLAFPSDWPRGVSGERKSRYSNHNLKNKGSHHLFRVFYCLFRVLYRRNTFYVRRVTYLPARTNDRFNWRAESMKTDSAPRPRMTASSPSGVNEGTEAALEPARAGTASTVPWSNSLEAPAELSSNEVTAAYGETIEEEGPAVGRRGFSPTLGSFRSFTKSMTKIRMRILISMPISTDYKTLKVPQVLTMSSCLATQKPPTRASQNPQNVPSVPKHTRRPWRISCAEPCGGWQGLPVRHPGENHHRKVLGRNRLLGLSQKSCEH
ncbi:unnamed protein product, partial [Nesidiocoris tenuis]